jgi:hypothetical protein
MALLASVGVVLFSPRLKLPGQMFGFLLLLAGTARLFIAAVSESSPAFTTGFGGVVLTLLGVAVLASRQRTTDRVESGLGTVAPAPNSTFSKRSSSARPSANWSR